MSDVIVVQQVGSGILQVPWLIDDAADEKLDILSDCLSLDEDW